jgi:Zn-dependent protease
MTPQNEIEEEIRRQMLAERTARQGQQPLASQAPPAAVPPPPEPAPYYAAPKRKNSKGGLAGIGAMLLAVFAKLKFLLVGLKLLTFGKIILTMGTMVISAWFYGLRYGWAFGVGLVALIFIHECGHALAARLRGIPTGIMVFIPGFGAFVTTKRYGQNITEDAFIGIMGPIVGTLASIGCFGLYLVTGNALFLVLTQWGFLVNLFNLAPTPPLDGGWITPLFSPKLLALGAVLLVFIIPLNPLIAILALLSLPRIIGAWKADPRTQPYFQAAASDRWKFGIAYLGLALFLALGEYSVGFYMNHGTLPFA